MSLYLAPVLVLLAANSRLGLVVWRWYGAALSVRRGTSLLRVRRSTSLLRVSRVTCSRRSTARSWTSVVTSHGLLHLGTSWGVYARTENTASLAHVAGLAVVVLDVEKVECVDVAWEVSEEGQADVDEEIGAAAGHDRDSDRGNWDVSVKL